VESKIFEYFRIFSNVFERFYPAYLAELPHFDTPTFDFSSKTNITPKSTQKNPHFSTIPDISSSELQRLLDEQGLLLCGLGGEMLFDLLADEL